MIQKRNTQTCVIHLPIHAEHASIDWLLVLGHGDFKDQLRVIQWAAARVGGLVYEAQHYISVFSFHFGVIFDQHYNIFLFDISYLNLICIFQVSGSASSYSMTTNRVAQSASLYSMSSTGSSCLSGTLWKYGK